MTGSTLSRIFGGLIVIAGGLLLLNNFGITDVDVWSIIGRYWPLLIVAWGVGILLRPRCQQEDGGEGSALPDSRVGGWIAVIVGLLILSGTSGQTFIDLARLWGAFWALLIILLGWSLLRSAQSPVSSAPAGRTHWIVMSGLEQKQSGWELRSGSYVVVMGGADFDLRVANIPEGETYLDLTVMMGGIEIIAPLDLHVECEGSALLGGVGVFGQSTGGVIASRTFSHKGAEGSTKTLRIRCRAMMGAVEVK
ncbi:MAG: LiaF-related protein [Clostridia bacterium]|nr:LiaF-related protein [Clostridia bacterium]